MSFYPEQGVLGHVSNVMKRLSQPPHVVRMKMLLPTTDFIKMPKLTIFLLLAFLCSIRAVPSLAEENGSLVPTQAQAVNRVDLPWKFFPNQLLSPSEALNENKYVLLEERIFLLPQDSGYHWGTSDTNSNCISVNRSAGTSPEGS